MPLVTHREDRHGSTPRRPDIVGQTRRSPAAIHIAYLMRDMCQSKAGSGHVDRLFYRGAELERLDIFFSFRQPTILGDRSGTMLFTKYARTLNEKTFSDYGDDRYLDDAMVRYPVITVGATAHMVYRFLSGREHTCQYATSHFRDKPDSQLYQRLPRTQGKHCGCCRRRASCIGIEPVSIVQTQATSQACSRACRRISNLVVPRLRAICEE